MQVAGDLSWIDRESKDMAGHWNRYGLGLCKRRIRKTSNIKCPLHGEDKQ